MKKDLFEELRARGFVHQSTNEEQIRKILNEEKVTFYFGIDPTADSLHIGHFFGLRFFQKLQQAGHKGIVLIGGGTGQVGDPTGRSDLRKMMDKETTENYVDSIREVIARFIDLEGENKAIIVDNNDWINDYSYIDFIREIGIHFNVNTMLSTEAYANRMEEGGLTFLEMGYMLLQAYDFVYLNKKYNCTLQIGGSDQWGNIIAGCNLHRKMAFASGDEASEVYGLTCPLLTTKEGKKMGKSEKGTLWVDSKKTPVFDFYQYFYNVNDEDVEMLLKAFSDIELNEIEKLVKDDIIEAKRTMAYEVTKLVHGRLEADKVIEDVKSLYGDKKGTLDSIPEFVLPFSYLKDNNNIMDLAFDSNFLPSKSEARRLIKNGGLSLNDERVEEIDLIIEEKLLEDNCLILKKGKKSFLKIMFE